MTDDWKDRWRDHKDDTGLTWGEYHDRYFTHDHDRADLKARIAELEGTIERLQDHLEAVEATYQRMHRDVFEQQIMEDKDE